ncbi:MAG: PhzF family phenazine biosynthesis protein [candidate division KSB1 bacterium]|nr:PhzF family phenazine biosynthesis protein [candidate division KSB1 bacterium]
MLMKIYQVDSFTTVPFRGNPAGVCLLQQPAEETWMRNVAAEMNLSETAFLVPRSDGYDLRWFTPALEVDLCGHATLASAHILYEEQIVSRDIPIRFFTKSGELTVVPKVSGLEMDFPAEPVSEIQTAPVLLRALGVTPVYSGQNRLDILLQLKSPQDVVDANPDFTALSEIPIRGVMITAEALEPRYDFVSRYFAPAEGIDEDPVTGSAHCALGPFWAEKLQKKELTGYQVSKRGGQVGVKVEGNRVKLSGQAVTVFQGELNAIR